MFQMNLHSYKIKGSGNSIKRKALYKLILSGINLSNSRDEATNHGGFFGSLVMGK